MTTTITTISGLPTSPYQGTDFVGIVITPNVPSYFMVEGVGLDHIVDFTWYPTNAASVVFEVRKFIPVNPTLGTCMIKVIDNFLSVTDRGGRISFRLDTGESISFPVKTYGPVSYHPLWTSPSAGLNTG